MSEKKDKILEVQAKNWSKEDKEKLDKKISEEKFKYRVTFELPNKQRKYAYSNDPITTEMYLRAQNAKIIKTEEIN